ncbi:MAG TPA: hypothetical protein VK898_14550, partial [Chloroflexota bacterium]|nr:hypothetical protein [Chloroflexota bacterium]
MDEAVLAWVALFALGLGALAILVWCFHTTVQAHMRAEALLREQLTPAELEQLNRFGYLRVASQLTSGREFEIPVRGSIMVSQDGKPLMRLCIR